MPTNEIFRDYERDAITRLCSGMLSAGVLDVVLGEAEFVEFHHSGVGYVLTVRQDSLPQRRIIGDDTGIVLGETGDVRVGFVAIIEYGELTLDCHNMGAAHTVPDNVRDLPFIITTSHTPQAGGRCHAEDGVCVSSASQ